MVELRKSALKVIAAALLSVGAGSGCNDEPLQSSPRDTSPEPAPVRRDDEYSLNVFVGSGERQQLVKFAPMDAAPSAGETPSLENPGEFKAEVPKKGGQLREQAVVEEGADEDGGGETYDTIARDVEKGYAPGWTLASLAAKTCSTGHSGVAGRPWVGVQAYPWENDPPLGVHLLTMSDVSCDGLLAVQEVMLCTADRLAEIADSPGTVYWNSVYKKNLAGTQEESIKVTIPPQATQDRFIARDMALNILAALAQTMLRNANEMNAEESCLEKYLDFVENPISNNLTTMSLGLFSEYFRTDGEDADHANLRSDVQEDVAGAFAIKGENELIDVTLARIALQVNVMAGAARLTKQLVEDSVNDDLAGAERVRSRSGDPVEGSKRMWGVLDSENPSKTQYYDSLRHAMKVLFGRLELSPNRATFARGPTALWESQGRMLDDPSCLGRLASNVIDAIGPGYTARWSDLPPRTAEQAYALNLLETAGIVLPPTAPFDRDALKMQLMAVAAEQAGEDLEAFDVQGNALAQGITDAFGDAGRMSDADLKFALARNYDAFRLLTDYPHVEDASVVDLDDAATVNGLVLGTAHSSVEDAGGILLDGGIPRHELFGNIMPRLAGAQVASQCFVERENGVTGANSADEVLSPNRGWVNSFQNPFGLAQVFQRQLGMVRDALSGTEGSEIAAFSATAAAEVKQWAGPGRVTTLPGYISFDSNPTMIEDYDTVFITGVTLAELGVESVAELKQVLVRVDASNPVYTECLIGQRTSCPTISESSTWSPVSGIDRLVFQRAEDVTLDTTGAAYGVGLDAPIIVATFPHVITFTEPNWDVDEPLSLVDVMAAAPWRPAALNIAIRGDAKVNGGVGRFLAAVRAPYPGERRAATSTFSRLQESLANEVFGIGDHNRSKRSCQGGGLSTAVPVNYCGNEISVKRDQFVPLANELTSEGTGFEDSWKHYLRVAKEASVKADQLGRELIDAGIQRDIRQEAALEEVANLCGTFPTVDGVTADATGDLDVDSQDDSIQQCMNPDTVDIVFLGDDPVAGVDAKEADRWLRALYCPSQYTDLGFSGVTNQANRDAVFCAKSTREDCEESDDDETNENCITHAGFGFVEKAELPTLQPVEEACGGLVSETTTGVSSPDATTLKIAVNDKVWSSETGLGASIASYHLWEGVEGEWVLSYEESPVLANTAWANNSGLSRAQKSDIFPACLEVTDDPEDPTPTDDYGNCSHKALWSARLIVRSSNLASVSSAEARARAEDAVHGLAALAGRMPKGTIRLPMPVADFDALDEDVPAGCATSDPECALNVPVWTIYAPGRFELEAGGDTYALSLPNEYEPPSGTVAIEPAAYRLNYEDRSVLGSLHDMHDLYLEGRSDSTLYPAPLYGDFQGIVARKQDYKLATPTNREIVYQEDIVNYEGTVRLDSDGEPEPGSGSTRRNLAVWYPKFADSLTSSDQKIIAPLFHLEPRSETADGVRQGGVCDNQEMGGPVFVSNYNKDNLDEPPTYTEVGNPTPRSNDPIDTTLGEFWPHITLFSNPDGGADEYIEAYDRAWAWLPATGIITDYYSQATSVRTGFDDLLVKEHVRELPFGGLRSEVVIDVLDWWVGYPTVWELGIDHDNLSWVDAEVMDAPVIGWPLGYHRLSPKQCSPGMRVELALPPPTHASILRGLGLSCLASIGGFTPQVTSAPPTIDSVESIRQLESWMVVTADTVNTMSGLLYLTDVPQSIVDTIDSGTVDPSAVGLGTSGQIQLDMAEELRNVQAGLVNLAVHFDGLRGQMQSARNRIQAAALEEQATQLALQRDTLELNRQQMVDKTERAMRESMRSYERLSAKIDILAGQALATTGMFMAIKEGAGPVISGVRDMAQGIVKIQSLNAQEAFDHRTGQINDQFYSAVAQVVAEQGAVAEERHENDVEAALIDLSLDSQGTYIAITDELTGIQNGTSNALGGINQLRLNQSAATVAMAKASGADFIEVHGQHVPLHLSTVYRRQYGVLKERYERALASAKQSAYLARLAIEQRLGTRFDNLHQDIGPLDAPSQWINDLCEMQGIDYEALREATPDTTPEQELDTIEGFADQYIGDYVDKLGELVEFYNLESPFKESDDTAILSLREVLGNSGESCVAESANLLFYSDQLNTPAISSINHAARRGWRNSGCDEDLCLDVASGAVLQNAGEPLLPPNGVGDATLLRTIPSDEFASLAPPTTQFGAPPNVVYQTVKLDQGERYWLSWWDMVRAADGGPLSGDASGPYRVVVYDDLWRPVSSFTDLPFQAAGDTEWSSRRGVEFITPEGGEYHVAFTPSLPGQPAQSVAIANVQIERLSASFKQVGYQSTAGSRSVPSGDCGTDDPAAFRARFSHNCSEGLCYYELNELLIIDTELLNQGRSPLLGQIALGNFNYRHVDLALNMVGTGILDCSESGSASCYGSGFVEYDMTHRAYDVPMLDFGGVATCFNFASGQIRSGKALSTERFLTLPLGSADRDLISQNAIMQTQFAGRPLDGSYSLRIRETPSLDWDQVEDIQLMINYRYWSHVR